MRIVETWNDIAEVEMGGNVLYSLEKCNGWLVACLDKMYYPTTTGICGMRILMEKIT